MGAASQVMRAAETGPLILTPAARARLREIGPRVSAAMARAVAESRYGTPPESEAKNELLTLDFETEDETTRQADKVLNDALTDYANGKLRADELGPVVNAYIDAHRTVWRDGVGRPFQRESLPRPRG